jgi:hypothetical protein
MMGLDTWVGVCVVSLIICGGIIARLKGDYFSRGAGITLFTSVIGIIVIIFSRRSRARINDEHDMQGWPPNSYLAIFAMMSLIFISLIKYWFF